MASSLRCRGCVVGISVGALRSMVSCSLHFEQLWSPRLSLLQKGASLVRGDIPCFSKLRCQSGSTPTSSSFNRSEFLASAKVDLKFADFFYDFFFP